MRILFLLVLLAGCAQLDTRTINLSVYTTAKFDRYSKVSDPLFFAVTMDGYYSGYSYCQQAFGCRRRDARQIALDDCKARSAGKACYVIANSNKIVWAGKVNFNR